MNTGVIAARYARTLLKYVGDSPAGEAVCSEAEAIETALSRVDGFRTAVENRVAVTPAEKVSLMRAAAGGKLEPEMESFLGLVIKNGREKLLKLILHDFRMTFLRSRKILAASLVTVNGNSSLEEALKKIVRAKSGYDVRVESRTDPEIIGGFVFTVDDYRIDASVAGQLESVRRALEAE